ncbi:MAG: Lrp/AsnC ligand binding domain-containing protein [Candidatus Hadarchaeum sp.]
MYIRTEPGKALKLLDAVKKIQGVQVAFATTGRFDIVARIEAADLKSLGETIVGKIQSLQGVKYTETSLIVA